MMKPLRLFLSHKHGLSSTAPAVDTLTRFLAERGIQAIVAQDVNVGGMTLHELEEGLVAISNGLILLVPPEATDLPRFLAHLAVPGPSDLTELLAEVRFARREGLPCFVIWGLGKDPALMRAFAGRCDVPQNFVIWDFGGSRGLEPLARQLNHRFGSKIDSERRPPAIVA